MPLTPTCDCRPMNAVTSRPPTPPPQGLVSTSSLFVWVRPSPTPYPLALTQAYYPLSAAWLNSDCWLVVEMEKEAFRVFIETHSFTRTITTLPHSKWKRARETGRESKRETDKLIFWFHISWEINITGHTLSHWMKWQCINVIELRPRYLCLETVS